MGITGLRGVRHVARDLPTCCGDTSQRSVTSKVPQKYYSSQPAGITSSKACCSPNRGRLPRQSKPTQAWTTPCATLLIREATPRLLSLQQSFNFCRRSTKAGAVTAGPCIRGPFVVEFPCSLQSSPSTSHTVRLPIRCSRIRFSCDAGKCTAITAPYPILCEFMV